MRVFRCLALAGLISGLLASAAVPASAADVTITPASGSQSDAYTVQGSGLSAGLALDINFISPDGTVFSTAALNQVVVVDPDGSFTFQFVPTNEFVGESLGTWTSQVCTSGTHDCVQTTFAIRL
jgi:hypothetical protein